MDSDYDHVLIDVKRFIKNVVRNPNYDMDFINQKIESFEFDFIPLFDLEYFERVRLIDYIETAFQERFAFDPETY